MPQVPELQNTAEVAAAVEGLTSAVGQFSFQENLDAEPAQEEQPAELPEWACA